MIGDPTRKYYYTGDSISFMINSSFERSFCFGIAVLWPGGTVRDTCKRVQKTATMYSYLLLGRGQTSGAYGTAYELFVPEFYKEVDTYAMLVK